MKAAALRRSPVLLGGLTLSVLASVPRVAFAESISWNDPTGGNWSDPLNWDPNDVPDDPSEVAVFPPDSGTFTTNLDTGVSIAGLDFLNSYATLVLGSTIQVLGGSIANEGSIRTSASVGLYGPVDNGPVGRIEVKPGHGLYLTGPTITNDGVIRINPDQSSANAGLYVSAYGMVFDGAGEVVMSTAGSSGDAFIASYYGNFTNGVDHTIHGDGEISCALTNRGLISADVPGRALVLSSEGKTNEGLLEAANGGVLRILSGAITQTAIGRIFANGGTVELGTGAAITSGRLESAMGSAIRSTGTTYLTGVTNSGEYEIKGGIGSYLYGPTVVNDGTIVINSDVNSANAVLYIASYGIDLQGSGEILLQAPAADPDAQIADYYGSFTQGPLHTIRGSGEIHATLINDGVVRADDPNGQLVLLTAGKTNRGTMESVAGGTLFASGVRITQSGAGKIAAASGGVTRLGGGVQIVAGLLENVGGTLETVGTTSLEGVAVAGEYGIAGGVGTYLYGTTTNDGTIVVNSTGSSANAVVYTATYGGRLDGSGDLVLRAPADLDDAAIHSYYGNLTQGAGHTIHGTGRISTSLTNEGAVLADVPGEVLQLDTELKTNKGTMGATSGGTLALTSATFVQDGGVGFVADGATVALAGSATVQNAVFATANGGKTSTTATNYLYDITNTGRFDHAGGSTLHVYGTTTNHGTWTLNPSGGSANAIYYTSSYGSRLEGTGELVLNAVAHIDDATIQSYYGNLTQGSDHTIRGAGRIVTTFTNEGTVRADLRGEILRLDSEAKANAGILVASDGGTLEVLVPTPNVGIVAATDSSLVRFTVDGSNYAGGTLTGGTWKAEGAGTLRVDGCAVTTLRARVELDGADSRFVRDVAGTPALTGLQAIGAGGFLSIRGGHMLTVPGDLTSNGDLVVGAGSTLTLSGELRHDPTAPRECRSIIDGVLAGADSAVVQGGWLMGEGTILADVLNESRANPGHPVGTLTIDGNYEQAAGAELCIDLGGTAEGTYDRLAVTGEARLGGTLFVDGTEGFLAEGGDSFVILTCGSRVGEFDHVYACPAPAVCMQVSYQSDRVVLTAYDLTPADVEEEPALPTALLLGSRMGPSGAAQLRLELPEASHVSLDVFDTSGRRVDLVHEGELGAGTHEFAWTGEGTGRVASGLYFVRAQVETRGETRVLSARALVVR